MSIIYKNGDLMLVTEGILAHGCNCQGVMGGGVAKLVKGQYPEAFDVYVSDLAQGLKLGRNSYYRPPESRLLIVNMLTQQGFGYDTMRHMSYDAIETCFVELVRKTHHTSPIHIPQIGAGLGGGNWKIIETIINETVKDREVACWIY